jgi:TonB family protein
VVSADQPGFGGALQAAIECFRFEPALKDGRPTQAIISMEQAFDRFGRGSIVPDEDLALLITERKHPDEIVAANKLDKPLRPISQRPPVFPVTLPETVTKGTAVVEILVDSDGYVRLPRVVSATHPAFGFAAVQAVASWRFEPLRAAHRSAVTRVRVPFEFISKSK